MPSCRRGSPWLVACPLILLTGLLLVGCEGNTPYPASSIYPETDFAHSIQDLYKLVFLLSIPVMILVTTALAITIIRFRARAGDPLPPQIHGNTRLEIAWTLGPAIILAIMAVPTVRTIFANYHGSVPPGDTLPIEIVGHQFWWEIRYPTLGQVVTANELRLPAGRPVVLNLTSVDVMHSFWIPRLGGKKTLNPNHTSQMYFTAERPGQEYYGQCGEFCGLSHANMRLHAFTMTQAEFDAWIAGQQQPVSQAAAAARGAVLFQQRTCFTCHVINGLPYNMANVGPNLTHVGSRTTIAAGVLDNTPENLTTWLHDPQAIKPGNLMPAIAMSDQDRADLVAYLQSLK